MSFVSTPYSEVDSRPSLTRESTACGTESTLPTPLDESPLGHRLKIRGRNVTGPRPHALQLDALRAYSASRGAPTQSTSILDQVEGITTPSHIARDSYFALEPQLSTAASRKNTAKDLISRYESMSNSQPSSRRTTPNPGSIDNHALFAHDIPRPLSEMRSKSKSTLRESFRSFVSIFKKRGKETKDSGSFIGIRYEDSTQGHASPMLATSPRIQHDNPSNPEGAKALKVGPLLYLSRPTSSNVLPVWTNCNTSLRANHITLEWNTAYGNPCSRTILLEGSNNVRSLAKSEMDPTEKSLLPDINRDAYVFEITYGNSEPEKFAINSVAERSAWVSAIWDTLLQLGKQVSETDAEPLGKSREIVSEDIVSDLPINKDDTPSMAPTASKGPLPPLPIEDEVVLMPLCDRTPVIAENATYGGIDCRDPLSHTSEHLDPTQYPLSGQDDGGETSLARKPTLVTLSRHSSAASRYSDLTEDQFLRPPQHDRSMKSAVSLFSKLCGRGDQRIANVAESEGGDNHSIYDFYTGETRGPAFKPLSPVIDVAESQSMIDPCTTPFDNKSLKGPTASLGIEQDVSPLSRGTTDSPAITALIQDHAVQQFSQTSDLTGHVIDLKNAMEKISSSLRSVLSEQVSASEMRRVLEELCSKIDIIGDRQTKGDRNVLYDAPPSMTAPGVGDSPLQEKLLELLEKFNGLSTEGFSEMKKLFESAKLSDMNSSLQQMHTRIEELLRTSNAANTNNPTAVPEISSARLLDEPVSSTSADILMTSLT